MVVGVGASAGGLEAFSLFLRGVPADAGMAIVFVQHLAPQHDSALVPLLTGQTSMPVVQAAEGLRIQANHVYVVPPNVQMDIFGDELHLSPRPDDRSQYTPIDLFLRSLAESVRTQAVGVILSGTASDGAQGIREIKTAGGLTVAQAPATAKYDSMPKAAIATGVVDLVLRPEAMGEKILEVMQQRREPATSGDADIPAETADDSMAFSDDVLQQVFDVLRPVSGIDFRYYKLPTIRRRLLRRMAMHRLTDPDRYVRLLQDNPAEANDLYRDLLIHVTRFFRDPESFDALASVVFPALLETRPADHPIRAWVPGCATGEEAYSLAIALSEFLQQGKSDVRIHIFATDVSEPAIDVARAGAYPASIEADVTPERLRRYFTKHDAGYRITKTIRDACIFARQDLTKDPPFSHLDLIVCRNVLIYMGAPMQKKLLAVFHYALNPKAFLMLGQAEAIGPQAMLFSIVDKKSRIHRKRLVPGLPAVTYGFDYQAARLDRPPQPQDPPPAERVLQAEVSRVIAERYAPPAGVVIDSDMQIVQFRGQTGPYLEPAPGEASLNVLKMAREGMLHGLRTAVAAARKTGKPARKGSLRVRTSRDWATIDLEVIPLVASGRPHFLILFSESAERPKASTVPTRKSTAAGRKKAQARERSTQLDLLQHELSASREYLQSIIQELEAANEELQSANEEIQSSNEELQSTNEELDTAKEELQSTNEELNTVNEELHGRNEELSRVNGDLMNLISSVQVAIVMVNANLRIRRFTPMAERVLNLIPGDLDRSIAQINPNIDCPDLEQLIVECIDTVSQIEREVRDRQGRWYALRIRPYKNVDNKIDGAVLTLYDIDAPKRSEERVRAAAEAAEAILRDAAQPMALLDADLRVRAVNPSFARLLSMDDDIAGRPFQEAVPGQWDIDALRAVGSGHGDGQASRLTAAYQSNGTKRTLAVRARALPAYSLAAGPMLLLSIDGD